MAYLQEIERDRFGETEDDYGVVMEGYVHQWVDLDRVALAEEITDKIAKKQREIGGRSIRRRKLDCTHAVSSIMN